MYSETGVESRTNLDAFVSEVCKLRVEASLGVFNLNTGIGWAAMGVTVGFLLTRSKV